MIAETYSLEGALMSCSGPKYIFFLVGVILLTRGLRNPCSKPYHAIFTKRSSWLKALSYLAYSFIEFMHIIIFENSGLANILNSLKLYAKCWEKWKDHWNCINQ